MTNCIHFMHPPKIIEIWWGCHDNFCVWKKSAITFGEGCTLMLDIHVYSTFMAWNLGYLAKKVHDIPPTLTKKEFIWSDLIFMYTLYTYKHMLIIFFILEIQFFCWEKITELGTSPISRHVMNYQLYQFVIVIDWSIKYVFLSAECRHALNYGHTDWSIASMIGLQLCTAWILSSCFNIHAYSILFYKENAT